MKYMILIASLALITTAQAQTVTTCQRVGDQVTCTIYTPGITHRPNPEAERALRAERQYYEDAYRYELERLDRENRR